MTFKERFSESIENFQNIDYPGYKSDQISYFTDFVELSVLLGNEDGKSWGDIQDDFFGQKDYSNPKKRDEDENLINKIYINLRNRADFFSENYPFDLNDNVLTLRAELSSKHKVYLSLLLSSILNIFISFKAILTSEFEVICFEVLKNYLPKKAVVKHFGKYSEYRGNAIEKIKKLAQDLNMDIDDYELGAINERNNQERGLDVIGWIPFADKGKNQAIFLGQSACGKEFESKQHDTRRFENYFRFYKINPQHILFIPYHLINYDVGKFYHTDLIENDYLVFERSRILEYYEAENFDRLETHKIVDCCIQYKSPLV